MTGSCTGASIAARNAASATNARPTGASGIRPSVSARLSALRATPRQSAPLRSHAQGVVVCNAASHAASASPPSARALRAFSPAKINVFLRVVRRREDGFHDLASLFHVIDLGDDMDIELLPPSAVQDELTCNWTDVPLDESNLVIKAANLFRAKTGRTEHFKVHLEKQVPHGAGMGGGSGNAATMLWAANVLCGEPASNQDLLDWSGEIGSDISVFFSEGSAYCTGRGEIVENVEPPIPLDTPLLLVKPPVGLSTPQIFKALDLDRRSTVKAEDILEKLCSGTWRDASNYVNDLEQPAFDCLPELKALKDRLEDEGDFDAVFMTGSGSTIVGIGSDVAPAFLSEPAYRGVFVRPARLITRQGATGWYCKE
jgi:4-diphosphocytidyl-2-C-methyl-D-erythritol kinase